MSNPLLVLARHGITEYNVEKRFSGLADTKLTKEGREQADRLGSMLSHIQFNSVFSSTKSRAKETMWAVVRRLNPPPLNIFEDIAALDERSYGLLEGLTWAEAKAKFPPRSYKRWDRDYFVAPPMGESFFDVEERLIPFYKKRIYPILEMGKNVLIISHSNTMKILLKYLYNMEEADTFTLEIENCVPFEVKANIIFKESK